MSISDYAMEFYRRDQSNATQGILASLEATLSSTPGTETVITLPDNAHGFRIYPVSYDVRFAVGETPATLATSSATTIAAAVFTAGGIAHADEWSARSVKPGSSRALHLTSLTGSVVVDVEVF